MSKSKKEPKYETGKRPWRDASTFAGGPGQKWTLWASWGVLLLVVLVCAVIWFSLPNKTPTAAGPAPKTVTSSTAAPARQTVCPSTESSTQIPTSAPADVTWKALYGNTWPASASAGPTRTVDGVAQCFQHSPTGAAFAAVNIMQTLRVNDTSAALQILDSQFIANAGSDVARRELPVTYSTQPPAGRVWGRTVGFKVESYRPGQAVLLLVENWPQRGQYTGYDITMVWQNGDWRVQLDNDGRTSLNGDITVDPGSYIPWETAATQ